MTARLYPFPAAEAHDKARGAFARLFVAIELPDEARRAIAAEQKRIAPALADTRSSLRWINPDQAHLTLAFLGAVERARAAEVADAITQPIDAAPFEMVLQGAGVFPPLGAPRVLWIGVSRGAREVVELQHAIAARVRALGIALEERAFSPHLTIGRWRDSRPTDRERAVGAARRGALAHVRVDAATLYESKLSRDGPAYTALARANLTRRSDATSSSAS